MVRNWKKHVEQVRERTRVFPRSMAVAIACTALSSAAWANMMLNIGETAPSDQSVIVTVLPNTSSAALDWFGQNTAENAVPTKALAATYAPTLTAYGSSAEEPNATPRSPWTEAVFARANDATPARPAPPAEGQLAGPGTSHLMAPTSAIATNATVSIGNWTDNIDLTNLPHSAGLALCGLGLVGMGYSRGLRAASLKDIYVCEGEEEAL